MAVDRANSGTIGSLAYRRQPSSSGGIPMPTVQANGIDIYSVRPRTQSLEEMFIDVTGGETVD